MEAFAAAGESNLVFFDAVQHQVGVIPLQIAQRRAEDGVLRKGALDKFKFEVASELGVPLSDGYNGNLTSKQNGSVGGYMVKKMIEQQERQMSGGSSGQY